MTKLKTLLLLAISFVGFTTNAFAGEHPEAYFGIYGIQHQSTVAGYQQYVGQVVMKTKSIGLAQEESIILSMLLQKSVVMTKE